LAVAVLLSLCGCQKGWLANYIRARGGGARSVTPVTMMNGVDCPDGLARCVAGAIEVSHVARIPRPCPQDHPDTCQCPWEAVENCPRGCIEEGTEVVAPPERAGARLCATDPLNPSARPATGAAPPPGACEEAREDVYRCIGSLVVACSASPDRDGGAEARVLAACVRGCFEEGESLGDEEVSAEAATRIRCVR
jgi:hypothetical protein